MHELRKANYDGLFFVTLNVVAWVDVFSRKDYVDILIKNLQFCQEQRGLEIYGYVIMTNHLQMMVAQQQKQLNKVLGRFKSYTAKQVLSAIEENPDESRQDWLLHIFRFHAKYKPGYDEYHFWQQDNHPVECFSYKVASQKLQYIHETPVRAGI